MSFFSLSPFCATSRFMLRVQHICIALHIIFLDSMRWMNERSYFGEFAICSELGSCPHRSLGCFVVSPIEIIILSPFGNVHKPLPGLHVIWCDSLHFGGRDRLSLGQLLTIIAMFYSKHVLDFEPLQLISCEWEADKVYEALIVECSSIRSIATTIKNILFSASIVRKLPLLVHTEHLPGTHKSPRKASSYPRQVHALWFHGILPNILQVWVLSSHADIVFSSAVPPVPDRTHLLPFASHCCGQIPGLLLWLTFFIQPASQPDSNLTPFDRRAICLLGWALNSVCSDEEI